MSARTYQDWETVSDRVGQSLALARILRELFWSWENEQQVGAVYAMHPLNPIDLRQVTDLLKDQLQQAEQLLNTMEPAQEVCPS